ncbi:hypothetical protein C0J52_12517 [Blattella germanica]|nr:hypothetical protein C0J52_12517 [Blattella germanica]
MVEPGGGKIKLRVQARDQDDQIESPEDEIRKDTNHEDLIAEPTSIHNPSINQGTMNKIMKQDIAEQLGNHKVQFIPKEHSPESKELLETSDSEDSVSFKPAQNHFGPPTVMTIQPTKWPYESILETEVNTVLMPDFHLHLSTNFNSPERDSQTQSMKQSNMGLSETNSFNDGVDISTAYPETHFSLKDSWSTNNTSAEDNNSQEVPFDMLKSVHQTLLQETPRTVQGKMEYLQQLSNNMLSYMEKHIKRLWIFDVDRQSRTEKGMGFPSSEGALMTLSFLIFAVFLIKLVKFSPKEELERIQSVYMDETCIHTTHTKSYGWSDNTLSDFFAPISKGNRLIIIHAGGENGFVPNAYIQFKSSQKTEDYHNDMDYKNYEK